MVNPRHKLLLQTAAILLSIAINSSAKEVQRLGPATNSVEWLNGANGGGYISIDNDDAPKSGFDFTISNTVAGTGNNADWRCQPFSLETAAWGARPIAFSFAYKFSEAVAKGNNVHVQLRFFDSTGTNFISEIVLPVGAHTGDSRMSDYKTLTLENILVPRKAKTADVWINANIFEPWVSGTARFGDISVTTAPRSLLFKASVVMAALIGICALIFGVVVGFTSSIKKANSPRERAFVIKGQIVCWLLALIFMLGIFLVPPSYKLFVGMVYVVGMMSAALFLKIKRARIRSEESKRAAQTET